MPPSELIRAILRAPVDLLWNGGIGTYVKASTRDERRRRRPDERRRPRRRPGPPRAASSARAATSGSRSAAGSSTRSAAGASTPTSSTTRPGVDTSDHEVNLKILLGLADRARRAHARRAERAARRGARDDVVAPRAVRQLPAGADPLAGGGAQRPADRGLRGPDGRSSRPTGSSTASVEFLPHDRGDGRAPRRTGAGMTRPGARGAARVREASLAGALLESDAARTRRTSRPTCAVLPAAGRRAVRPPARRAPAAARARSRRSSSNDVVNSQGITFVSRMVDRDRARTPPTSCGRSGSRATSPAPSNGGTTSRRSTAGSTPACRTS